MMQWLIRLAFPALGLLLVLIFFGINDPETTSQPSQPTVEAAETMPSFEGLVPTPVPKDGPQIVFKWRDDDGGWHYADRPPEQGSWNALAVEPSAQDFTSPMPTDDPDDWQSPYAAPFSLDADRPRNDT